MFNLRKRELAHLESMNEASSVSSQVLTERFAFGPRLSSRRAMSPLTDTLAEPALTSTLEKSAIDLTLLAETSGTWNQVTGLMSKSPAPAPSKL